MKARPVLATTLLVALLFAGCGSPPAAPETPALPEPEAAIQTTYPWGLSACRFVIARAQVQPSSVQDLLPSGFRPAPSTMSMGSGGAEFHMDAYECDAGVDLDGSTRQDVSYASFYVPVLPPDGLLVSGSAAYFVKLDTLEPDDDRREALQEAGFPIHNGQHHVTEAGPAWDAFVDLGGAGGAGSFIVRGSTTGPLQAAGELPFVEYTPLSEGGLARWQARLHDAQIAPGTGVVLVSGLPAQVLGAVNPAQPIPVEFIAGTWNLDQANVTFPVPWP